MRNRTNTYFVKAFNCKAKYGVSKCVSRAVLLNVKTITKRLRNSLFSYNKKSYFLLSKVFKRKDNKLKCKALIRFNKILALSVQKKTKTRSANKIFYTIYGSVNKIADILLL